MTDRDTGQSAGSLNSGLKTRERGVNALTAATAVFRNLTFRCDPAMHRVIVSAANGDVVLEFGGYGSQPGAFDTPIDAALVKPEFFGEGNDDIEPWIAVADYGNRRVQVFELDGALVGIIDGDLLGAARSERSVRPAVVRPGPRSAGRGGHAYPAASWRGPAAERGRTARAFVNVPGESAALVPGEELRFHQESARRCSSLRVRVLPDSRVRPPGCRRRLCPDAGARPPGRSARSSMTRGRRENARVKTGGLRRRACGDAR